MGHYRTGANIRSQKTTPLNTPKNKISRTKGQSSRRTAFVRDIAREVVGLAPYERRIIELLRNTQDKRARKLAKKRVRVPQPALSYCLGRRLLDSIGFGGFV